MRKFAVILLISLFLGTGGALATGGDLDSPEQRAVPQSKIVVNVPPPENDWVGPAIGATGAVLAAVLGLWGISRRSRKGN